LKNERHRKNENGSTEHPKGDRSNNNSFYCSEHGENLTHATADCFTLKNRDKSGSQGANHSFSNKSFRKEVKFLAKKSSKKKVLDMYVTAIKREQKKMQKQIAKRKPREVASSDSESDSDVLMHNIEPPKSRKSSTKSKTRSDERTGTHKISRFCLFFIFFRLETCRFYTKPGTRPKTIWSPWRSPLEGY
jgi:hypothetical protein